MHRLRLRKPSPAMAVAIAALFVALGGTAMASFGQFKGDKIIEKHSLSGNRLKNHTITGTQVNLGKLGTVPSASHADTAGSATTAASASHADTAGSATTAVSASPSGAAGGDLTGSYPNPTIAPGAVTASKLAPEEGWHEVGAAGEPAFQNSWTNYIPGAYATAAFFRDARGFVHVKGVIKSGTGVNVFTLPAGYRPATTHLFPVITDTGAGYVAVDSDGTVRQGSGGNGYASLEPIEFRVGS